MRRVGSARTNSPTPLSLFGDEPPPRARSGKLSNALFPAAPPSPRANLSSSNPLFVGGEVDEAAAAEMLPRVQSAQHLSLGKEHAPHSPLLRPLSTQRLLASIVDPRKSASLNELAELPMTPIQPQASKHLSMDKRVPSIRALMREDSVDSTASSDSEPTVFGKSNAARGSHYQSYERARPYRVGDGLTSRARLWRVCFCSDDTFED